MQDYLKKCDKKRQISLYCVFGDAELPDNASSPAPSVCCKYAESPLRSPDLEAGRPGREISTSACVNFSEATWICGDSSQVKPTAKRPSAAELEEFFTEAEEYVQKRFAEKYNYDIVKDAPILGGRYQWFRTHI
ncbi:cyclin-dependent kinase inhibitor 6-like [Salvia divinorum]|uniref:Cyclin-dependent kinase inhibitor 6-like n=1 Tax=Salvia divinorum TaxID=28513 RepID=A0ABD1GKR1_SALDI